MADFDNRNRRNDRNGRGGDGHGNNRRDGRARAAEKHTADMGARFGKEIERALAGVEFIDGMPKVKKAVKVEPVAEPEPEVEAVDEPQTEAAEAGTDTAADLEAPADPEVSVEEGPEAPVVVPEVTIVDASATQAVLDGGRGYAQFCDLALLDFASFVNPGGGYIRGAFAQEEALCADSYLYNVLKEQKAWYGENRRRNINCELYRNRGMVVPAVRFERNKMHAYADVIVVAAPNARRAREEYNVADAQWADAMRDRIRFVLAICDKLGREKLVAGAFGCGAFGGDAEQVAQMFREELASGNWGVKQVVFAVPQSRWDENLPKFNHVFANYPAANDEPYAVAAKRAAEAKAAEAAAAAADDDEDDDDWRKYL